MADPSADRPLLFTDQDVELVADALTASNVKRWEQQLPVPAWCELATAAVRALADAGRLAPVSAEHREEWRLQRLDIESHKWDPWPMPSRRAAEIKAEDCVWGEHARPQHRTVITWAGPWVEVDENTGGTDA